MYFPWEATIAVDVGQVIFEVVLVVWQTSILGRRKRNVGVGYTVGYN